MTSRASKQSAGRAARRLGTGVAICSVVFVAALLLAHRRGRGVPEHSRPGPSAAAAQAAAAATGDGRGGGGSTPALGWSASAPRLVAPSGGSAAACPADMALVHGWFCPLLRYVCRRFVDDAEYRCAEYARDQRCLGKPDLRRYCIDRYEWPNRVGDNPLVHVTWNQAKALCSSAGKRLCRRSEWVLACEGPKRLPYPWGYLRQPSPCNIDRAALPFDAQALEDEETRELELARLWQADRIGAHPDCVSAYGVFDMSGNVDEWTDNRADNPSTSRPSTLNGGYWGPVRDTCRLTTKSHGPKFRFYQVGFRCCRDAVGGAEQGGDGPVRAPRPWIEPEPAGNGAQRRGDSAAGQG